MRPFDQIESTLNGWKRDASGELVALGACVFAGGFSFGIERAGFTVAGHFERDDLLLGSKVASQRWPVFTGPFDGPSSWTEAAARLRSPDLLYANPPCVAYAGTGKREGAADSRMCYTRQCTYGLAFMLQPSIWVWELVPGVFDHERPFLEAMAFRAKRHGYRCYAFLTSSALHGGVQDRRRFHFFASRFVIDFESVYASVPAHRKGVMTLGELLQIQEAVREVKGGKLKNDTVTRGGAFSDIMPYCPPGSHLRDVPPSLMRQHYRPNGAPWGGDGRPGFAHTRARLDRPCPNILGGPTVIHPVEDRYLTPRECASVMGFPEDYAFSDSAAAAYAEVGKGLCTQTARFIGDVAKAALTDRVQASPVSGGDTWMEVVDWRSRVQRESMVMTKAERAAWYMERHGSVPGDL